MKVKSNNVFPVVFNSDFRDIMCHSYTEYCEAGGRGSCKSSFISVCIILLMLKDSAHNVLVLRKVADTLTDSVFEQLLWAIDMLGLNDQFKSTKSPLRITYLPTGQRIIFRGADEPKKIKSIKLKNGYFAITWFEELTEFTSEDVTTIKLSTMRGGNVFWIFYSYNPPSSMRNWCNVEFAQNRKNLLIHRTDYRTVPRAWLGDAFFDEAESMKERNERAYQNVFLGMATGTGRNVFENVTLRAIPDSEIQAFDYVYGGVDFGYYPDPFMYICMSYDAGKQTLYIYDELHLLKHGNYEAYTALRDHMEAHGMSIANDRITADSAEPKSIADFRQWGANMRGALKGKGSLETGFKWLQSLKAIIIDPARAPHAADEFTMYEHEIDRRTGEIIGGYPQGQPDHAMAAVRYALECVWHHAGE